MGRTLRSAPPTTAVGTVADVDYPEGANNGREMLLKLRDVMLARACTAIAVNAGGSGYQVGEIIEVSSAGGSFPATFTRNPEITAIVTSVSTGAVTGLKLKNAGALVTDPSTTTGASTATLNGSGTGLTVNITMAAPVWTLNRQTSGVASATVSAGGTGYVNSETVNLTDLGSEVTVATATVTVSAGAITAFSINTSGIFHKLPSTLIVTGGTGTGGVASPTYAALADADETNDREMIFTSTLTDGPVIGFRTHNTSNWELAGLVTYDAASTFSGQPMISPGRYNGSGDDADGSYTILRALTLPDRFDYHLRVTERAIKFVFTVDNAIYASSYIGFGDPVGTSTQYPYPMVVDGCASRPTYTFSTTRSRWGGITLPVVENDTSDIRGPFQYRTPGGVWRTVRNGVDVGGQVISIYSHAKLTPPGTVNQAATLIPVEDRFFASALRADASAIYGCGEADTAGGDDAPIFVELPAPGSATHKKLLRDCVLSDVQSEVSVFLALEDVRWIDRTTEAGALISAEDEIVDENGDYWVAYHNGANTGRAQWFAMKESP